jgi:hypothetical protein
MSWWMGLIGFLAGCSGLGLAVWNFFGLTRENRRLREQLWETRQAGVQ